MEMDGDLFYVAFMIVGGAIIFSLRWLYRRRVVEVRYLRRLSELGELSAHVVR